MNKKPKLYAQAYFISPEGVVHEVPQTHIVQIVTRPELFGLERGYVEDVFRRHGEPLGCEQNARNEIIADLLRQDWIRVRCRKDVWVFQISGESINTIPKQRILCLLKMLVQEAGYSQYSGVAVINLDERLIYGGDIQEVFESWESN